MNIKDVAKIAGVSISTISRVINKSAYVSPEISERIEKILAETGYRPNSLAKELLRSKTNTIGVMLPRIDLGTFAAMFDGVVNVLNENGYHILLANTRDEDDEELRYLNVFYEKRVDGILYFATGIGERHVQAINKLKLPVVVVGQSGKALNCSSVALDSFAAAKAMVSHLIALGHSRIGCLAVDDHDENLGLMRKQGYFAALAEHGIEADPALLVIGDFEYRSGEVGAEALMALPGGAPTAIFCIADRLAVSTCAWLTRHGYRVPDDVSVACIDDPALLSFCAPSITAMSFDYQTMGTIAGKLLLGEIDKGKGAPGEVIMPYTLQERASTRAVN